jgi:hypothetical protein
MPRRPETFPLVLAGFVFGFTYLFKTMFEGLLYTWVLKQLDKYLGVPEAEVIAKLSEIGVALFAAVALVYFLYQYIAATFRREAEAEINKKQRLKLSFAADKTQKRVNGSKLTYLYATNEGQNDVSGVQVKIEEARFRSTNSDKWVGTSIVARTNMSWGHLPDGDPHKYSTIQLAPGSEILDFINGPLLFHNPNGLPVPGFAIRVDPTHAGIDPRFGELGTYKFVIQLSALDIAQPEKLTLFADWDGKRLLIRADDSGQVLETATVLEA